MAFCNAFCGSLDHFGFVFYYDLVLLGLVFLVRSQEIGREERLRNDLFCVEWDVKRYTQLLSYTHASVIKQYNFGTGQQAVMMPYGWKGNRGSDVALVMRHRLKSMNTTQLCSALF